MPGVRFKKGRKTFFEFCTSRNCGGIEFQLHNLFKFKEELQQLFTPLEKCSFLTNFAVGFLAGQMEIATGHI